MFRPNSPRLLLQLDVPILNAIALNSQSRAEWERSPAASTSLNAPGRSAARTSQARSRRHRRVERKLVDVATGETYVMTMPIAERVERLAAGCRRG